MRTHRYDVHSDGVLGWRYMTIAIHPTVSVGEEWDCQFTLKSN